MRSLLVCCFAVFTMLLVQFLYIQSQSFYESNEPVVTAQEIRAMQNSAQWSNRFVVVDVRAKSETDISVIPGAVTKSEFERDFRQYQGKLVVAYCTVGYRSGIYAKELANQGWNSRNYKGSILDWCEHQLPLVTTDGRETSRVHTYSSRYKAARGYRAIY